MDRRIIKELAQENQWRFKLATIDSEINKEDLLGAFQRGELTPFESSP